MPLGILDLDVLPPEILEQDVLYLTFWTWTFRTQDVSPSNVLDLDVLLLYVSDQDVSPPNFLNQNISTPNNCFVIQNICSVESSGI